MNGCICYLHILGAPGSVKEQGLILHLKTGVWERSFPLREDSSLVPRQPQLFLCG